MIVLDCNAAVNITLETEAGLAFLALIEPEEEVIAPEFFKIELHNALLQYVRKGILAEDEAFNRIKNAEKIVTEFVPDDVFFTEAFTSALRFHHSFYDMLYLCMARRNNATLFTLDKKLIGACIEAKVNCTELVDF